MCPAHAILSEIPFLWTRKPTAAEGPHLEKQKGKAEKREKKRINPFLRKISGCPFRVGCGWSSFLSHIFLCQWLDPGALPLSPGLPAVLLSAPPTQPPYPFFTVSTETYSGGIKKYLFFSGMVLETNLEPLCVISLM